MPFLFAFTVLGWAHLIVVFRSRKAGRTPILHFIALFVAMLAFMDAVYLSPFNERGVPVDARNWVPIAVLGFGLVSSMAFGWKFYQIYKGGGDRTRSGWRSGLSLSFALLGVYLASAAIDHLIFFTPSDQSGTAAAEALGVPDIRCDQMVLVRLTISGADYRCPASFALGGMSSAPFVPWPSYEAGHSREVKAAITSAGREAHRVNAK